MYVRDGINFIERTDHDCPESFDDLFTYKFIEIINDAPKKNAIIGVLYRPPGYNTIQDFVNHLNKILPKSPVIEL